MITYPQVVLAATHIDTHVALAEAAIGPYAPSAALQLFGAKILAKITSRQVGVVMVFYDHGD